MAFKRFTTIILLSNGYMVWRAGHRFAASAALINIIIIMTAIIVIRDGKIINYDVGVRHTHIRARGVLYTRVAYAVGDGGCRRLYDTHERRTHARPHAHTGLTKSFGVEGVRGDDNDDKYIYYTVRGGSRQIINI